MGVFLLRACKCRRQHMVHPVQAAGKEPCFTMKTNSFCVNLSKIVLACRFQDVLPFAGQRRGIHKMDCTLEAGTNCQAWEGGRACLQSLDRLPAAVVEFELPVLSFSQHLRAQDIDKHDLSLEIDPVDNLLKCRDIKRERERELLPWSSASCGAFVISCDLMYRIFLPQPVLRAPTQYPHGLRGPGVDPFSFR